MRKLLTIFGCVLLLSGMLCAQFTNPLVIQVQNAGTTIVTTSAFLRLNCSTNVTCTNSGGAIQITASATASSAFAGLTPGTNVGTGNFIFSGVGTNLSATAGATITATAAPWSGLTGFPSACTNQAVTGVGASLTCTTLTSAYVDTSIAKTGTDINTSNQVTVTHLASGLPVAQGGTGVATLTGIVKASGTSAFSAAVSADVIGLWTGTCSTSTFLRGDGSCQTPAGAGTVTSVAQTVPSGFAVAGTPVSTSGTLAITYVVAAADQLIISTAANTASWATALTTCGDGTHAISYSASTHTFGCQTLTTGGAGTVTSVGFTGGLISVATATTTPAFTVAGTSGGVPYFSGASTWASSGAMASGQFMLGGGAGNPPTTSFSVVPVANGGIGVGTLTGLAKGNGTSAFTAAASADVIAVWSGTCSSTTFLRGDGSCQTPAGSGTTNAATQFSTTYYSAAGSATTLSGVTAPTANGQYSIGYNVTGAAAVAPTISLVGLASRAVTATTATDTILYSDNVHDVDYQGSVAVAVTLPTGTTLGNTAFVTRLTNAGSTTNAVTVTPTTWTINGSATLVIATGQSCAIKVDASGSAWDAICNETQLVAGTNITLTRTAFGLTVASTAAGPAFQVNATPLTSSATVNYQDSTATNGLTIGFSNPSAGNVKLTISGTITNAGLTNSSTTANGQTCTLGSTCNVNVGATAHGVAINEGNGSAIAGTAVGATNTVLLGNTGADPTFGAVPNAALVNASTTANGQTCTLGGTCNVNTGSTAHGVAINEGNGNAIASTTAGTALQVLASGGSGADGAYKSIADISVADYVAGAGTAQAQTATLATALTALTTGAEVRWLPSNANSGAAPTLAVNGLTAKPITKLGTTALVAGDLSTTAIADAIYDGTEWQLQNPQTGSGGGGGVTSAAMTGTWTCSDWSGTDFTGISGVLYATATQGCTGTEAFVQQIMPQAGHITAFYAHLSAPVPTGKSLVLTIDINGTGSAITCTMAAASQSCNITGQNVAFSAADLISIKAVGTAAFGLSNAILNEAFTIIN